MKVLARVFAVCIPALACGCDAGNRSSVDEPYTAPRPAHPAMTAPAGAVAPPAAEGGEAAEPVGGLPAGHPPIGTGSAAPGPAPAAQAKGLIEKELSQLGLLSSLPGGWIEDAPGSPMRLATIRLPRVEGDTADGEISVSKAGGTLEDNIERWRRQFQENPEPVRRKLEAQGIEVTVVEMEGTFLGGGGPAAAKKAEPVAGTRLWGAIVKAPRSEESIFFKAWGPKRTMERWKGSLEEFVSSLRPSG